MQIRNMYSRKVQNKISQIVNGLELISSINKVQTGGSIDYDKNKYSNKINNKIDSFIKNSNILLNFDKTLIKQYGGSSGSKIEDLFTNNKYNVDFIKEKIDNVTNKLNNKIGDINIELIRLREIEKKMESHTHTINSNENIINQLNLEKNNLEEKNNLLKKDIEQKNKTIIELTSKLSESVDDKTAKNELMKRIEELTKQIEELTKSKKNIEEEYEILVKEKKDITDDNKKLKMDIDNLKNSFNDLFNKSIEDIKNYEEKLKLSNILFNKYEKLVDDVLNIDVDANPAIKPKYFDEKLSIEQCKEDIFKWLYDNGYFDENYNKINPDGLLSTYEYYRLNNDLKNKYTEIQIRNCIENYFVLPFKS